MSKDPLQDAFRASQLSARVPNETLQEQIYRQLRHFLMVGRFRPGQPLKIRDIAESFETSMQPVREAIRQLTAEQALEASPNASTRVPVLDDEQLEDLRSVRLAVEGLAAERAVARIDARAVAELARILSAEHAADEAMQVEASIARNLEFHFRLYSHSGSTILPSIIEGLWLRLGPCIRDAADAVNARGEKKGVAYHSDILKALRKKDGRAVRDAIEHDINRFFDVVRDVREASEQAALAAKRPRGRRPKQAEPTS